MNFVLNAVEARVLGSLVEKEITTPDYYPLSLNALINACNQKSNRDPLMNLDEVAVRQALRSLNEQGLARSSSTDSRVSKYEHHLQEVFNFHRHEIAVLCVLLLRGPQTPGELRVRAERMYGFEDLDKVQAALQLLMKREPPMVKILPKQAGNKEARYMHLLCGDTRPTEAQLKTEMHAADRSTSDQRERPVEADVRHLRDEVSRLHDEVARLQKEFAELKNQLAAFRKQFD